MKSEKNLLNGLPSSLQIEMIGEILIVKLCRPDKRNALNDETVLGIEKIFNGISQIFKT